LAAPSTSPTFANQPSSCAAAAASAGAAAVVVGLTTGGGGMTALFTPPIASAMVSLLVVLPGFFRLAMAGPCAGKHAFNMHLTIGSAIALTIP
jgi:hypothetical protein